MIIEYARIAELTKNNHPSPNATKGLAELDAILTLSPQNIPALIEKGFILFQEHCDGEAISIFQKILDIDPLCLDAYVWIAEFLLFHWADAQKTIAVLQQSVQHHPSNAIVQYLLGYAYKEYNDIEKFLLHTERAIELDPTLITPRLMLMQYFIDAKKFEKAQDELSDFDKHLNLQFPRPHKDIDIYYETLITGRLQSEYRDEWIAGLRKTINTQQG